MFMLSIAIFFSLIHSSLAEEETAKLCVFSRPNQGLYILGGIIQGSAFQFEWGHSLIIHIGINKELTYLGSPDGIKTTQEAASEMYDFLDHSVKGKAGFCYNLSKDQEEKFQNKMVGALLEEVTETIGQWEALRRNCTHFVEDFFQDITNEDLLVSGIEHASIASPNILARRIINENHSFQDKNKALTIKGDERVLDFFVNIIKEDSNWELEDKLWSLRKIKKINNRY